MEFCPLCNGIEAIHLSCPKCQTNMEDQGKLTDFLDDYSPYLDIDMVKMVDGDPKSLEEHQCLHYFYCPACRHEEVRTIQE